jgi:antirestriction protein ArdC
VRRCAIITRNAAFAREELVAELGASYLMADLGLAYTPRPDHAAYLASWLGALRHDPKAIFNAAAQAQAAADWIHAAHKAAAPRWRSLHEARHGHCAALA